jgi:hypothetical protein
MQRYQRRADGHPPNLVHPISSPDRPRAPTRLTPTSPLPYEMETTIRAIASAAVACYVAGLMVGTWVHRLNDRLARHWVCWWCQTEPAAPGGEPECLPAAPAPAPAVHPLATLADTLQSQPVAALRRLAGVRSKCYRKAELAAMLVAC